VTEQEQVGWVVRDPAGNVVQQGTVTVAKAAAGVAQILEEAAE